MNRSQEVLTDNLKRKYLPKHLKELGFSCIYCGKSLYGIDYVFEHLDDNRTHNEYTNIALACQSCNIKKANDYDMKLKALDLKKQREEKSASLAIEDPTAMEEISSERKINKLLFPFTQKYIEEHVNADGKLSSSDALHEIGFLSQQKFGCGSEPTIRRYIKQLTCGVAPFQIITDELGKDWIVRRTLN